MGRRLRFALAAGTSALAAATLLLALAAHDAASWRSALIAGDGEFRQNPSAARWRSDTWLPGDRVRAALGLGDSLELRRAVRLFVVARQTGVGFDNGATRDRVRSGAEVALSDAATRGSSSAAAQASNLLGVLVAAGGKVAGGVTADDRARSAFEAAVRRDPANTDAKYNLELILRRTAARAARQGQGNGTGSRGRGRRGAGAGTPGRGY
jgi:hypothetical protein